MGLAEAKRKQRLVGSARTRNAAWSEDQGLPGQRLLASMGWQQGQGIGAGSSEAGGGGRVAPVAVAFKLDNKGIGAQRAEREARAAGKADAWVGGNGDLGDLFARLNAASTSSAGVEAAAAAAAVAAAAAATHDANTEKKSKKSKRDSKEERRKSKSSGQNDVDQKKEKKRKRKDASEEESSLRTSKSAVTAAAAPASTLVNPRMAARVRYLRAKRMVGGDAISINEILGIASPAASDSAPASPLVVDSPTPPSTTTTDTLSEKEQRRKERKEKRKAGGGKDEAATDNKKEKKRRKAGEGELDGKKDKKKRRAGESEASEEEEDEKIVLPTLPTSSDPSFDSTSGGGNRVSTLSVQQYLANRLIIRRAEVLRNRSTQERMWRGAADKPVWT